MRDRQHARMHETMLEPERARAHDLASIVLGSRRPAAFDSDDDEWGPRRAWSLAGYDPRSALLLALVVAALAAVVAAVATPGRDSGERSASAATTTSPAAASPADVTAPAGDRRAFSRPGVDLAVGGIQGVRTAGGGQLIRVRALNRGTDPVTETETIELLLLVDGAIVDTRRVDGLSSEGSSVWVDFVLPSCEAGRHSVTAIADPRASVREPDENDNASSRELRFRC